MLLKELVKGIYLKSIGPRYGDYDVKVVTCDSRERQADGLFVALPGFKFDGNDFIKDAVAQGARVVVKKGNGRQLSNFVIPDDVCVLDVEDPKVFLRPLGVRFYDNPSSKVRCIAVTGTNGKTTVTYMLESIIHAANKRCGVIGTINYRIGKDILPSKNTTPGFLDNQKHLADLSRLGVDYCVMETSSHALEQGRVDGINYVSAIFTNLTQDHLDYHKTMEEYFNAKAVLFKNLQPNASAVINIDDPYGKRMAELSKGKVTTYAIDQKADVQAVNVTFNLSATKFDIAYPGGKIEINTPFIGRHNIYNCLSAFASFYAQGLDPQIIKKGIESLRHVPGRLERVECGQDFHVFIDYAHTDDGLINVLNALRAVTKNKIIVVFGCGGDRDKGKRPKMGKAASELADYAIVTSDNPRSEDPEAIIKDILGGISKKNYEVCVDRKEAIQKALEIAQKDEVVLLAGKGHEDYQILKDKTIPFDERIIVADLMRAVK